MSFFVFEISQQPSDAPLREAFAHAPGIGNFTFGS
jgi:hypothetical protein